MLVLLLLLVASVMIFLTFLLMLVFFVDAVYKRKNIYTLKVLKIFLRLLMSR